MQEFDSIAAVIGAYERCWNERRFRDLRQLWAADDTMPIWLPEEVDRPLTGWDDVEAYLGASEDIIDRFAIRTADHRFKPIVAGVVSAVWTMRWNATTWFGNPPRTRAIAGDVRVSAVFREVGAGDWRFVHYHESALGPLPFVRRAYEALADPGFAEPRS